jgi:hypothetical protein
MYIMGLTNEMFIQYSNDFHESADYEEALALYIKKRTEAEQPKLFYSKVTIVIDGNEREAYNKQDYISLLKEEYSEIYGFQLADHEIEVYEVEQ